MKKKMKWMLISMLAMALLFTACGNNNNDANGNDANKGNDGNADVVTTASLVNDAEGFIQGVSEDGRWIVSILNDVTIDEEVTVAGTFYDKDDTSSDIYRKIALYEQDADRNVTATFTLTVPKLTVQSENLNIQGGVVKGDVIVEANGFMLHETSKIEGNLTFANEEVEASATIDGEVTGETEVK